MSCLLNSSSHLLSSDLLNVFIFAAWFCASISLVNISDDICCPAASASLDEKKTV